MKYPKIIAEIAQGFEGSLKQLKLFIKAARKMSCCKISTCICR